MKLALVQHDIAWENPEANFAALEGKIAEAAGVSDGGAQLVLLTEMFSYGFSMATDKIAEPMDGPSTEFLLSMARKYDVWVGGSIPELDRADSGNSSSAALPKNTLVVAAPDGSAARYSKIHPFSYADEHEHYRAGDQLVTLDIGDARVGLSTCYDLRFAYLYWQLAEAVDLFVVVANWPAKRRQHWRSLLVARAIENQAWVAGVNRVGSGGGIDYCGDSLVVNPMGEIVADGNSDGSADPGEAILHADIDPAAVAQTRQRFPFLADRLTDFGSSLRT